MDFKTATKRRYGRQKQNHYTGQRRACQSKIRTIYKIMIDNVCILRTFGFSTVCPTKKPAQVGGSDCQKTPAAAVKGQGRKPLRGLGQRPKASCRSMAGKRANSPQGYEASGGGTLHRFFYSLGKGFHPCTPARAFALDPSVGR